MKNYHPSIHHRRSIRLKGYDYSQSGLYFVTMCVKNQKQLFGKIISMNPIDGPKMILNDAGQMVQTEWLNLPKRFKNIHLHEYIVMPNHFHAILEITDKSKPQRSAPTLGDMVGAFQSITTVNYIRGVKTQNWTPFDKKVWLRNYWEHIIRDEKAYQNISRYITNNPRKWWEDKFHTS